MAVTTKWDTAMLADLVRKLDADRQVLAEKKDFLININSEVETAWQGYAGRAFDRRMDIDAENIEKVIKGVESLIDDLTKVVSQCYEPCEEAVKGEIASMLGKI
ncbi:MAG: hypothetical protein NC078_03865 [Ruminococcus sp.]|nr:hypothetical protein [Ruminococcus sp.]